MQIINADGDVAKTMTLADIQKYPKHTVTVTLQCAGNRRSEMHAEREVKGLQWKNKAISTATWSGAKLSDVLHEISAKPGPDAVHVQFVGLDCDVTGVCFFIDVTVVVGILYTHLQMLHRIQFRMLVALLLGTDVG